MSRFIRCALAACLCALSCAAAAQQILPPPPEQVHIQRIDRAILEIREQYVDALEEEPLARRCVEGMEGWLAGRSMRVAPGDAPRGRPVERAVDLIKRVGEQFSGADLEKLSDACLKSVAEGLDKLSSYMDRASFRDLQVGTRGDLGGIGVEIKLEGDYTAVVASIENAPASRSDLQPGDLIVSIDGVSTKGLPLDEVVRLMRGKVGSTIVLELQRPGTAGTLRREFKREIIRVQSVRPRLLEDRLLYVRISQFQESTRERFLDALEGESRKLPGGLAGVILDLRNNSGGLLNSCVGVAAAFLPEKAVVVELRGRTEANNRKLLARPDDYNWTPRDVMLARLPEPIRSAPLALLVNRQTAACSEIVAAALQDHRRARIIGEKTYGIGTVQTILPLPGNSALKLTTARYYRPSGAAFENNPVTPDIAVAYGDGKIDFGGAADPALPAARKLLLGR